MKTEHFIVTNIEEFTKQVEAIKKLNKYLNLIDKLVFPIIEEVFGYIWNDDRINIILDNSTGGASYRCRNNFHIIKMGIYNRNIQQKYPKNLWGCLFHETHHAFFNQIINNKTDQKIFNGGYKGEPFNYTFMAITYLKLKKINRIDEKSYEYFLHKLETELQNGAKDLFNEYVDIFSVNIENFSKFIFYLKLSDTIFTNRNNFRQDFNKFKEFLAN